MQVYFTEPVIIHNQTVITDDEGNTFKSYDPVGFEIQAYVYHLSDSQSIALYGDNVKYMYRLLSNTSETLVEGSSIDFQGKTGIIISVAKHGHIEADIEVKLCK